MNKVIMNNQIIKYIIIIKNKKVMMNKFSIKNNKLYIIKKKNFISKKKIENNPSLKIKKY
jgi:hypothetical protein